MLVPGRETKMFAILLHHGRVQNGNQRPIYQDVPSSPDCDKPRDFREGDVVLVLETIWANIFLEEGGAEDDSGRV
ncbi:hypothetical protein MAR_030792 [Mya arenaria]|uniref:Uncharacterized protein n=1 Tax=Mya arenaria TaxID=6604 RepID=A0ABY7F1Y4_MYAAR|nr:hypothetical protein MAR_030731 [Mya arenaria]WAR16198.1 hypothetical protein MAR_030792 [Mya arenaria]